MIAMKLESKRLLRGPNRWSEKTAVEGIVVLSGPVSPVLWQKLAADYPEPMARVGAGAPCDTQSALFWAYVIGRLTVEL